MYCIFLTKDPVYNTDSDCTCTSPELQVQACNTINHTRYNVVSLAIQCTCRMLTSIFICRQEGLRGTSLLENEHDGAGMILNSTTHRLIKACVIIV